MAKMKFKFDMAAVKQFLFEKGERVGLIACTVIMVAVVGYSLYSGLSSRGTDKGDPWDKALTEAADRLKRNIASVTLNPDELKTKVPNARDFMWVPIPYTGHFLQLFPAPDKRSNKKLNPFILPIITGDEDKLWQLNYYACGINIYNIDVANRKATVLFGGGGSGGGGGVPGMNVRGGAAQAGASNLAKNVRPTRMVVVSAIFPMRDQLEEYRKALRYASVEELLAHRDELPKPIGLDVSRSELLPDGTWSDWKPLFQHKNGKLIVEPTTKDVIRRMMVDEDDPQLAAQYIFPGLVTPLPKLANAEYAKLDLKGFDVKARVAAADGENPMGGVPLGFQKAPMMPGRGPAMPGKKGMGMGDQVGAPAGGGANFVLREELWTKAAPAELQAKFNEKFNVFDPLAQATVSPKDKKGNFALNKAGIGQEGAAAARVFGWDLILGGAGGQGFPGMGANPMRDPEMADGEGGDIGPANAAVTLNDALVRFFDPTVQPGKTYCYAVRVRMANPNHGKPTEVEFQALAAKKELDWLPAPNPQGFVASPAITIPADYFFYATDQVPEKNIKGGADSHPVLPVPFTAETTPIQVHRWLGEVPDPRSGTNWLTADWAIAERLHTRRGEPIGRREVLIEMGRWNMQRQMFEIGISGRAARKLPKAPQPNKAEAVPTGIPVDLVTVPPTLVVDFDGGKKSYFTKRDGAKEWIPGEVSAVELLVLMPDGRLVLRNSRVDSDTDTPTGAERQSRFEFWRDRIAGLRRVQPPAGGGDEAEPMIPDQQPDN